MEENNKKKVDYKIIIIVILVIMLIGTLGYIAYDKISTKDVEVKEEDKKEKEENNTIKELTADSEEVKELMEKFVELKECDDITNMSSLNDNSAKIYMAYTRVTKNNISCSEVENSLIYGKRTCGRLESSEQNAHMNNMGSLIEDESLTELLKSKTVESVSKNDFDNMMKELFGNDIKYTYDDIFLSLGCDVAYYNQTLKKYIRYSGYNCGGACSLRNVTLQSINQENDKLTLVVEYTQNEAKIINYNFKYEDNHYIFVNME